MKLLTQKDFISKSRALYGDRYDYSSVVYRGMSKKVILICRQHGPFEQLPSNHLKWGGCKKCRVSKLSLINRKSKEQFLKDAARVHGDTFDYTLIDYKNWDTSISIICRKHGSFKQRAGDHLAGKGCRACARQVPVTDSEYLQKFRQVHGAKYEYPNFKYIDARTKIDVVCKRHGLFKVLPYNHIAGNGCRKCKTSLGELCIGLFLDLHGVKYSTQKTFKDCKVKFPLPFDYFIEPNILIEFDGEGHFKPINWGGKMSPESKMKQFEKTCARDAIKNSWAAENDFILIRISYLENLLEALATKLPGLLGFSLRAEFNNLPTFDVSERFRRRLQFRFLLSLFAPKLKDIFDPYPTLPAFSKP